MNNFQASVYHSHAVDRLWGRLPGTGERSSIPGRRFRDPPIRMHATRIIATGLVVCLTQTSACIDIIHGDCVPTLLLRATLVDADVGAPVTNAAVGGKTFTAGEVTDFVNPVESNGFLPVPPPDEDGSFELRFATGSLTACPPPEFPRPDQVEVIVLGGGCQQTFAIDVNADTVVDIRFPGGIMELKEPIVVPPCPE